MLKATVTFVMSVRLSAWNTSAFTGRIYMTFIFEYFRKYVKKIQVLWNSDKNTMYFTFRPNMHFWSYFPHFFLVRNVSERALEKIKTHILSSVLFPRKSCCLWYTMGKYWSDGQVTDDIMAHAHCMRYTSGHRHILRMCNIYCFSSATLVITNVPHCYVLLFCLSCLFLKNPDKTISACNDTPHVSVKILVLSVFFNVPSI